MIKKYNIVVWNKTDVFFKNFELKCYNGKREILSLE